MRISVCVIILAFCRPACSCWYQSKNKAFNHIHHFLTQHGMNGDPWDPTIGITRNCLEQVVHDAPIAVGWLINKVDGVDGVFKHCDTNKDGLIYIEEAREAKYCVDDCWKQMSVQTFLN